MNIKLLSLILVFGLFLLPQFCFSQCPPGNIVLSSQAEVDAFSVNYPDCTELTNGYNFTISGADITDLSPLSNLNEVQFLRIVNNPSLVDISALSNISGTTLDIIIIDNPLLSSLNGLQGMNVEGLLYIINNDALTNLNGLSDEIIYIENFVISDNDLLQNLGNIGGGVIAEVIIENNPMLNDISAFNNFSTSGPFLTITNNSNLAICDNNAFCGSISNLSIFADLYPYFLIENNAEGCDSVGEVAYACEFVPFNDECDDAFPLTIGQPLQTYSDLSTTSMQIPSCNDVNRLDVWFKINSESFSNLDVIAEPSYNLQLWQGDCSDLTQVVNACAENALLDIPVMTNTDYYVQVWSDTESGRVAGLFDILVQDGTLTNEDFAFKDFTLYPNPTKNILNLKSQSKIDFVKVYNLLGQQISSSIPNSLVEEINMSELNSGMYLISIEIDGRTNIFRVIKE